ncbi:MAG: signal peptide peptidase SppA [Geminicoccaceae bacterium]
MRRFAVGCLATVGALALLTIIVLVGLGWYATRTVSDRLQASFQSGFASEPMEMPERIILELDLRGGIDERVPEAQLRQLGINVGLDVPLAIFALRAAVDDARVVGLLARVDGEGGGLSRVQEFRDAILALREAGKFTYAWSDSFGEFGPGQSGYYLATAFEDIAMQPLGAVGLTGLRAELFFLKDTLAAYGVEMEVGKREEYKSALDMLTESQLDAPNEQALRSMLDSLEAQMLQGLTAQRGLSAAAAETAFNDGPYVAADALELGLIDRLAYWDEAVASAEDAGNGAERVSLNDYANARLAALDVPDGAPGLAFIHASGPIHAGESTPGGFGEGFSIGADTVADAFQEVIDSDEIQAVLFRVDSPGGSAVASETIGRQIRRTIERGKPVIVSMGDVAASGGYWISMDSSLIVAQPTTITGSIGVIIGKPNIEGLLADNQINHTVVGRDNNGSMWSIAEPYSNRGRAKVEDFLDHTYSAFLEGVAQGRDLSVAQVRDLAGGRVWTGAQALELGLVDQSGGLYEAYNAAKEAMGLGPDDEVELITLPRTEDPFSFVWSLFGVKATTLPPELSVLRSELERLIHAEPVRAPELLIR